MTPVDEGLIHAWLDGQLSPAEAERVERLVATDAAWGAAAAEARGLFAGASRILGALDAVPLVRPAAIGPDQLRAALRRPVWRAPWIRVAATVVVVAGVASVVWRGRPAPVPVQAPPAAPEAVVEPPAKAVAPSLGGSVAAQNGPEKPAEKRTEKQTETDVVSSKKDELRSGVREAPSVAAATALPSAPAVAGGARAAKAAPAPSAIGSLSAVDARLVGCWQQVDSGAAVAGAGPATLLIVASTLNEKANQAPTARLQEFAAGGRLLADARSTSIVVTPRRLADATWEVAWMRAGARTTLSFSVRGDTLRGVTTTDAGAAGDAAARGQSFVAVRRTACPQ